MDAQCDKIATELSRQRLRRSTFLSYLSKVTNVILPHLHLAPPLGVTPFDWVLLRSSPSENWSLLGWTSATAFYLVGNPRFVCSVPCWPISCLCLVLWTAATTWASVHCSAGVHGTALQWVLCYLSGRTSALCMAMWCRSSSRPMLCTRSRKGQCLVRCLWPPYVIGQAIIFLPCGFFLSSIYLSFFIPRLISAVADWMSTILWHMVWP